MEKSSTPLADLDQLIRHLDLLHEELIDFENSLLRLDPPFPERFLDLIRTELECEKSLITICAYLNKRVGQVLRTSNPSELLAFEPSPRALFTPTLEAFDQTNRPFPLSATATSPFLNLPPSPTPHLSSASAINASTPQPFNASTPQPFSLSAFLPQQRPKSSPKTRRRGPYRRYSESDKRKAINTALRLGSQNKAAEILNLPIKNLKRWIKNGPIRRKGGRKTQDPLMEEKLLYWIDEFRRELHKFPSAKDIRERAKEYGEGSKTFKASKGWLEKFMGRHYSDEYNAEKRSKQHSEEPLKEENDKRESEAASSEDLAMG